MSDRRLQGCTLKSSLCIAWWLQCNYSRVAAECQGGYNMTDQEKAIAGVAIIAFMVD